MQKFHITIGSRQTARLTFEAIAPDSMTAVSQHEELALPGERVEVSPIPSEQELLAADLAYLRNQKQRDQQRVDLAHEVELNMFRARGML